MAKIIKLTPEQEAMIPAIRDEFLRIGLSTEPADFDAAEQAVKDAYAVAGLQAPKLFIRLASPMEGAIAAAILKGTRLGKNVRAQVWDQVRAQVWDQVRAQVWDQVWDQVRAQVEAQVRAQVEAQVGAQVGAQVRAQVGAQVWDQVRAQVEAQVGAQVRAQVGAQVWAQVWDQVGDQVEAQVGDQVRAQVGAQVRAQVGSAFFSQHEAGWLSFYAYFAKVCGLSAAALLEPLTRISRNCGWVWFFSGAAIITDRPRVLRRDDQNRLHCEDVPAIEYRDGLSVYAWHGTRIPKEWVEDRARLSAKTALTWQNIEQRRAALEIVGWHNVLRELKAKVIDEHPDPACGSLVEVQLPDLDRKSRFIRAQCGTKREFAIGVPPEIQTVIEAQSWLTGLPVSEFQLPTVRT